MLVRPDSPVPAAAARGRRAAPASRSRQQAQRENALQLAVQRNHAAASNGLQPEQQLAKAPANDSPGLSAADLAAKEADQPKPSDVTEQRQPPPEELSPGVQELEKEEVEVLVCSDQQPARAPSAQPEHLPLRSSKFRPKRFDSLIILRTFKDFFASCTRLRVNGSHCLRQMTSLQVCERFEPFKPLKLVSFLPA